MYAKNLTEDQKNKIHSALNGVSKFQWSAVDEAMGIQDSEDIFFDTEAEVMGVCDLEYCEQCGWIFSTLDGYGECDDDSILCTECGDDID